MSTFYLKTKSNDKDVVSKILAESYEDAVYYFAKVKKLSIKSLLDIFIVVERV